MPLPIELTEVSRLSQKISELLEMTEENLSQNAIKLNKAKNIVTNILREDFLIPNEKETSLNLYDQKYFQEQYSALQVSEDIIQQVFNLFKKLKRIKTRLENVVLNDSEINKLIQRKFVKVTSSYGEGTGYIEDDEQGVILSSFHLVGAI